MKSDEQASAEYAQRIRAARGDGPSEMEIALDEIEAEIARLRSNPGSATEDQLRTLSAKLGALAAQNAPPRAKVPATAKVPARADGFRRVARRS